MKINIEISKSSIRRLFIRIIKNIWCLRKHPKLLDGGKVYRCDRCNFRICLKLDQELKYWTNTNPNKVSTGTNH